MEYRQSNYTSPIKLDIEIKKRELHSKELEYSELQKKYEDLWKEYNPVPTVYSYTSKSICTRCHLRLGHTKNSCHMDECESASVCGQVDRHPVEKKELQELAKKKQKLEGECKVIQSELKAKEKISNDVVQSFEARVHDILIRTNPTKYLTEKRRPKEGVFLADSYIIKKYYASKKTTKSLLEMESDIFQTIIKSYEEKAILKKTKNSVVKQLERQGIQLMSGQQTEQFQMQSQHYNPMNPYTGGYAWNYFPAVLPNYTPPQGIAMQQLPYYTPNRHSAGAVASPPPPPPQEENLPPPPEEYSVFPMVPDQN